jgi:hypothetical protein
VSGSGGTFTVSGKHVYQSGPGPWLVTIKLEDDNPGSAFAFAHSKASVRDFTATPTDKVKAGSAISYQGSGFDASGTSIVVGWDDLVDPIQNTTFGAALSFNGTQSADFGHPTSDFNTACTAKLTATQDGTTDTIAINGVKDGVVLADRNFFRVANGQAALVQPPDFVCHGEQFASGSPADVIFDDAGTGTILALGRNEAVFNLSDGGDLTVPVAAATVSGRVSTQVRMARGATLCLPLGQVGVGGRPVRGGGVYGSVTIPDSPQGPYRAGQIGSGCLSSAPHGTGLDVVNPSVGAECSTFQPGATIQGDLRVSGQALCYKGSLTVTGDVLLSNGDLGVTGNLTVLGSVRGSGTVAVNGGTAVGGMFHVSPNANDALIAGGDVDVVNP